MISEGTEYVCKPKDSDGVFFKVTVVLPNHEGQPAKYRVLNEQGMICYLQDTGDIEMPFMCVMGLINDGEHPSEMIASPDSEGLL
jgi:hypothetical protein